MTRQKAVELARAVFEHHRRAEVRRKRSTRQKTWEELTPSERARLVEQAQKCIGSYWRSDAREVPLTD